MAPACAIFDLAALDRSRFVIAGGSRQSGLGHYADFARCGGTDSMWR